MPVKKKSEETVENNKPQKKKVARKANGQFEKGCQKLGGRKPGSKNKYGNIRDRLKDILLPYLETDPDKMTPDVPTFAKDLMKITDPKDRADVISKYLPFVVPKYSATTISADTNRPVDEEQELLDLDNSFTKKELTLTLKQVTIVDNDKKPGSTPPPLTDFDPDEDADFDINSLK